jgi:hypothetical protein
MSRGKKAKRQDHLLDHPRLKSNQSNEWRAILAERQGNICPICGLELDTERTNAVDHCHKTGLVRGTLHIGCNAVLGKVENAYVRMGKLFTMEHLMGMSPSVYNYVSADYSANPYHWDHRTEEEKRLSRNDRARQSRKKKKTR